MNAERITNLAEIDLSDLPVVRGAVERADAIGHWRRILAIYGDHLVACAMRVGGGACDCGWSQFWEAK